MWDAFNKLKEKKLYRLCL